MLNHLDPASTLAMGVLIFALIMVIMFEATNGFHDAANAVATVIYTKSLPPGPAVVLSGVMNFVGVCIGRRNCSCVRAGRIVACRSAVPPGRWARGCDVGVTICGGLVMEYWNVVVRLAQFYLALFDRCAHRRGSGQCVRPLAQPH
jgi:hypothetical protein